ncbi:MAG: hypothetical protein QM800_00535 [Paludibacter sp.]
METLKTLNSTTVQVDTLQSNLSNSNEMPQTQEDTIAIEKKFTEVYGYRNGALLSYTDYKVLFADAPAALSKIRTSNSLHKVGNFFGFVGGFMFGFIGVMGLKNISSVDYTWGIALGTSAAVAGVGFLFYKAGNNSQIKAINIYNGAINGYPIDKKIGYLKIGFTNSGVRLTYNF